MSQTRHFLFFPMSPCHLYKTLTSLCTLYIKGHIRFLQLLKWLCRTSSFTHVEPYIKDDEQRRGNRWHDPAPLPDRVSNGMAKEALFNEKTTLHGSEFIHFLMSHRSNATPLIHQHNILRIRNNSRLENTWKSTKFISTRDGIGTFPMPSLFLRWKHSEHRAWYDRECSSPLAHLYIIIYILFMNSLEVYNTSISG